MDAIDSRPSSGSDPKTTRLPLAGLAIVEAAIVAVALIGWALIGSPVAAYLILAQGVIGAVIWWLRVRRRNLRHFSLRRDGSQ